MLNIGIIGTGGMANSHATNFQQMRGVRVTACCDVVADRAAAFAAKHGIPRVYTDYRAMLDREKLHGVTNVTPDAMHAEISLAVIARGLAILCEKPLATTLDDAIAMRDAAQRAGVINMVNFSYRNASGLQKAAEVVRKGTLGRIIHVEASYLQSWLNGQVWGTWQSNPGLAWRLSTRHGSAGDLGDIGCHIYDMATFLAGQDIAEINCQLRTFDKGVPGNTLGEYVLDANDSFVSIVSLSGGALGVVHSSRWATGQANSLRVRVYGDAGGIEVDLDRDWHGYRLCTGKDVKTNTWKPVSCKPTPTNFARFIRSIRTGVNDVNDFANGAKIQAYLHYSFASDAARGPVAVALPAVV
jgi:predicted dehydrogenase